MTGHWKIAAAGLICGAAIWPAILASWHGHPARFFNEPPAAYIASTPDKCELGVSHYQDILINGGAEMPGGITLAREYVCKVTK